MENTIRVQGLREPYISGGKGEKSSSVYRQLLLSDLIFFKMPWPSSSPSNVVEVVFCRTKCNKMAVIHQDYYFHHNRKYKVRILFCDSDKWSVSFIDLLIRFFLTNREVITGAALNADVKYVSLAVVWTTKRAEWNSPVATRLSSTYTHRMHQISSKKSFVVSWSRSLIELQPVNRDRHNQPQLLQSV